MKRSVALFAVLLCAAAVIYAHGDEKHVQGTVARITADTVVVKTTGNTETTIKTTASTVYVLRQSGADKAATRADLSVGDRVLVHASLHDKDLVATQVRFLHPAATQAAHAVRPQS
jgi:hypothetical protein